MSTVVKDLGAVSAYAYAVEKGYTGTEEEFAELMASYADVGQTAVDAAESALDSKTAAQTAATTATNKASEATTAAQTATTKAGEASQSASTATSAKDTAVSASQTATSKATEATTAAGTATTAKDDAVTAKTAAETAQGKAEDAQAAAEAVAESIPSDYSQLSKDVTELKSDLSVLGDLTSTVVIHPGKVTPCYLKNGQTFTFKTVDGSNFINNSITFYDENMNFLDSRNESPTLSERTIVYNKETTARFVEARAQTVDILLYPAVNVAEALNNIETGTNEKFAIVTDTIYNGKTWEVEQDITAVGQYARAEYNYIPKGTKISVYAADDHTVGNVSFNVAGKDKVYQSITTTIPFTAIVPFDVYYSRSYVGRVGKFHLIVETSVSLNELSDAPSEIAAIKSDPKLNKFVVNQNNTTVNGVTVRKVANNAINLNGTPSTYFNLNIAFYNFDLKKNKTVTFMMTADKDLNYSTFHLQLGYFKSGNTPVGLNDKVYLNEPYTITFPDDAESLRAYLHTAEQAYESTTVTYDDVTVSFFGYYDFGATADVELKENLQGNSFNSTLHDGLEDYIELATKFSLLMNGDTVNNVDAVSECEAFLFFTDPHTQSGSYTTHFVEYMGQIQKMYHSTPCNFVLCGGDWLGNSDTPDIACYKMGMLGATCRSMLEDCYMIVGNHDTNYQGKKDSSSSTYTTRLPNESISNLWYQGKKAYYSFNGSKTKFYVFDTGIESQTLSAFDNYGYEQAEWFANSLLAEQSEHIAVAMHMYYTSGISTTPVWSEIGHLIMQIAAAYNMRSTITVNGTQYDFSNVSSNRKVEFAIAGHTHEDLTYRFTESGADIPVLITVDTGYHSTYPTNASFDLVFVDYDNRIIKTVRVGSGADRQLALST